jgi:hypothetical protein
MAWSTIRWVCGRKKSLAVSEPDPESDIAVLIYS